MQQHLLFAAIGGLCAACLALLSRAETGIDDHYLKLVSYTSTSRHHQFAAVRAPVLPELVRTAEAANQFFISQYHSRFNPRASAANANCGPVCLAMALKRFYAVQVGNNDAEELVSIARNAMTGQTDPDENTDNDDVIRGASSLGLFARRVPNLKSIDEALDAGALAIVSGSPGVPGSFASRLAYHHCHSGHFIVLAGREGNRYFMCDPESPHGTAIISRSELAAFLSYWPPQRNSLHGAVALWPIGSFSPSSIARFGSDWPM
jgi:hypothetical protein